MDYLSNLRPHTPNKTGHFIVHAVPARSGVGVNLFPDMGCPSRCATNSNKCHFNRSRLSHMAPASSAAVISPVWYVLYFPCYFVATNTWKKITNWTVSTVSKMLRRVVEVVDFPDVYRAKAPFCTRTRAHNGWRKWRLHQHTHIRCCTGHNLDGLCYIM